MAIWKPKQIESFIARPDDQTVAILLHGPNDGKISETANRITAAICPDANDPFSVVFLKQEQLRENPGLLRDEALSMSFTQNRKVIRIQRPGPDATKQFTALLAENILGNLVVIEADNLKKGTALRKTIEQAQNAAALACYEDTAADSRSLIHQMVKAAGKEIENAAVQRLTENFGTNRFLLKSELDKLLSYCLSADLIHLADVEILCNDAMESGLETICDLVLTGQATRSLQQFENLSDVNFASTQLLNSLHYSMTRLTKLRFLVDTGKTADIAIKSARPPIFFKRHDIVRRQLKHWTVAKLKSAETVVFTSLRATREHPELAKYFAERALMNIAVIASR